MKNLFQKFNKTLLDNIMELNKGIIECHSITDPKNEIFECYLFHVLSEGDDEYKNHLFI